MQREKELLEKLLSAMHRIKRSRFDDLFQDLSQQDFLILQLIAMRQNKEEEGVCVSKIAERMRVSSPAISRKLGDLESRELIIRMVKKEDRRNTYVCLTKKGEQTRQTACSIMEDLFCRVVQNMGEDKVLQLIELWNQFSTEMLKETEKIEKGE